MANHTRAGAWPRWLLIEDVIADDFVIENNGRSLCYTSPRSSSMSHGEWSSPGSTDKTLSPLKANNQSGRRNCQVSIPRQKSLTAAQQVFETAHTAELL
ncbi:MAG TPA: hypothetical protein VJ649_04995 [Actinomycetes bacterium]|nr:hypothetical protein [Actinomycetes bacterium]